MKWKIQNLENGIPAGEWDFPNDSMIVYEGLYGAPRCFTWYADVDKSSMLSISPMMRLAFDSNGNTVFWDDFTIKRTYYDASIQKFVVYGESEIFVRLNGSTELTHNVFSSNPSNPKNATDVLEEVLSSLLVPVELITESGLSGDIGYTQFSFEESTSVLDIISKICRDNRWEWFLDHDRLIVGEMIDFTNGNFPFGDEAEVIRSKLDETTMKVVQKDPFKTISMPAKSIQPGAGYENNKRVLWIKYYMGEVYGDVMTFLTLYKKLGRIGPAQYGRKLPDKTLRQNHRDWYGSMMSGQPPIMMGKCISEPGSDSTFREEYRMPEFGADIKQMAKKHEDMMFEEKYRKRSKQNYILQPKMTTPYAGDGQGLLFPQSKTNKVLFTPRVGRELSLVGPSYFGDEMEVPKRDDALDFRLQLPDGTCLYNADGSHLIINAQKELLLTVGDMGPSSTTEPSSFDIQISSNSIAISDENGTNKIEISSNGIDIKGSNINIQGTTKIQGTSEMNGNLKVNGQVDMMAGKTVSLPNIDSAVIKKIPPGP